MAKKLSTKDILAAARKEVQSRGTPGSESAPAAETEAAQPEAAPEASQEAAPAEGGADQATPPASTPRSTKDILAAARAQAGGGGAKPAAPKPAAAAPSGEGAKAAPRSTKDILAAARAQKAAGAAAGGTATAAPAPKAKPAGKAAPAAAGGSKPSVQDMLKAVREGAPVSEQPKGPARKPVSPAARAKAIAAEKAEPAPKRRNFLLALVATPFAAAWTFLVLQGSISLLALARFMMPNVLVEPPSKFKIGPPDDYPFGQVSTKWKAQYGVWIVHTEYRGQSVIYALASVCTHLGCTPNWLEGEQKFKCPCHGSGFYITGVNFEGPAPRPLERVGLRLAEDGLLEVDKSLKFQEELGQWQDPASFVAVV